eukprot:888779-Pleurochrysis_carterae.AAC.1
MVLLSADVDGTCTTARSATPPSGSLQKFRLRFHLVSVLSCFATACRPKTGAPRRAHRAGAATVRGAC